MTVEHEIKWRRKHWLAKVEGIDRDGPRMDFLQGQPVKSRGVLVYDLDPGWYAEMAFGVPTFLECDGLTVRYLPSYMDEMVPIAAGGPPPGSNGAWNSSYCACGAEVERYTPELFPKCEDCWDDANTTPIVKPELAGNIA